jgi:signal peptidase I
MRWLSLIAATIASFAPGGGAVFRAPSAGMAPTIPVGGRVVAAVGAYDHDAVRRGDIVLVHPPRAVGDDNPCGDAPRVPAAMCAHMLGDRLLTQVSWIERVVGLPGDRLSLVGGRLMRNGRPAREPFIAACSGDDGACDFPATITVPDGRYFVLGDNRTGSDDSRFWGAVPRAALFARVDGCRPQPPVGCPSRAFVPAPAPRPHRAVERLRVPSQGMAPTLDIGDHVLANHRAYDHAAPQLGDIVVFRPPASAESDDPCPHQPDGQMCGRSPAKLVHVRFIKRIVGLPGDRLSMRHGRLIRNGTPMSEPYIAACTGFGCDFPRPMTVPPDQYYVLGDNRGASDDSRFWGPVPRRAIVARVDRCIPQPRIGCPRRR